MAEKKKKKVNATKTPPARLEGSPLPAPVTQYQRDVIKSAAQNHIWLNAFFCIRPTDEFKLSLANQILFMLNNADYLICDYQDSDDEVWREIGKLTPELVVRFNKS